MITPSQKDIPTTENAVAAAADLEQAARGRWQMVQPDATEFWRSNGVVECAETKLDYLGALLGQEVVLGFLGRSHLGDAICTSMLPRLLVKERDCRVYSARLRSVSKAFESNAFLSGYRNENRLTLSDFTVGPGHMIQRLTRAFGFGVDPFPPGELYFSDDELKWAWGIRRMLPRNRPLVIVSVGSVTDNTSTPSSSMCWNEWIRVLSGRFTVLQTAITSISCIEEVVRLCKVKHGSVQSGQGGRAD